MVRIGEVGDHADRDRARDALGRGRTVDVVDADTNAPIPTPRVTLGALDDTRENAAHFGGFGTKSDENGRAEFAA